MVIAEQKMSKSKGNIIKLEDLDNEAISPIGYRYWLLTSHYRSQVNFTFDAVRGAQNALIKLMAHISQLPNGGNINNAYKAKFEAFIGDDFNMPQAIALSWELLKDSTVSDADKKATLIDFDRVFGLDLANIPTTPTEPVPPEIIALAEAREEARKEKDWAKADAIREEIEARGFVVKDTTNGVEVVGA
jgi:cysteinyl-tRNA synthetase